MEGSLLGKMGKSLRLFLGLPLAHVFDTELREYLIPLSTRVKTVHWIFPESFHATLHFFGNTPSDEVSEIRHIVEPVINRHPPLSVRLTQTGYFPSPSQPKVLWLGIGGDVEALRKLQLAVVTALRQKGYFIEKRPYHPHATLGRINRPSRYLKQSMAAIPKFNTTVEKKIDFIALYKSCLTPQGARYEIFEKYALGK